MDNVSAYKKKIKLLMEEDYEAFTKAFISIEKGIEDKCKLDYLYSRYMDSSESSLLNKNITDVSD